MNLTAILSAIVTFIRFIPDLIKIWREFSALIQSVSDKVEQKEKAKQVAEAIKKARETKDTGDLEKMFGKSFDITFKTVEKKSLNLGLLSVEVKIDDKQRLADKIQKLQEENREIPPLKKMEDFVSSSQDLEVIDAPEAPSEEKKSFFSMFGRSSSTEIGASFVNHVFMTGSPRMTSKFFLICLCFGLASCKTGAKNEPDYKPVIFAGDSDRGGITRKQSGQFIRATDPKFDNYAAVSYETLSCIHKTYIANCREYKEQEVKCDGANVGFIKDIFQAD